jgi:hypothetical protein
MSGDVRQRIDRATRCINAEVQVGGGAPGVAGIAHEPDHIPCLDVGAGRDQLFVEVRVVMRFAARGAGNPHDVSAEPVDTD